MSTDRELAERFNRETHEQAERRRIKRQIAVLIVMLAICLPVLVAEGINIIRLLMK